MSPKTAARKPTPKPNPRVITSDEAVANFKPRSKQKEDTPPADAGSLSPQAQSRAVREYLEALGRRSRRRGPQTTVESLDARIERLNDEIELASLFERLHLIQEQLDCQERKLLLLLEDDIGELEARFVAAVKPYSDRKGITWAAWREVGVPAAVLRQAGLTRALNAS